ncbi:MAG: TolC family protein, partial [Myxococcota bacterium]
SGGGGVMEDTGGMPPAGGMAGGGGALAELLRIDASVATLIAERAAVDARLRGEIARLGVYVGEDAAAAVAADPEAYRLTGAGPRAPELGLAEVDRRAAAADVDAARAQLAPDVGVSIAERVMPEGMPESTNVAIALELPLWGRHRKDLAAARASEGAAEARAQAVRRDLDAALASARGAEEAAEARARVLAEVAVPRAGEAFEAARARYAAGQGSVEDVLRAWEALVAARRAHVAAARDHDLRAAERARVEGR